MELVKGADKFYKMWSVQLMSLIFVLEIASNNWSQYSELVPEPYHGYVQGTLAIFAVIARLIRQKRLYNAVR